MSESARTHDPASAVEFDGGGRAALVIVRANDDPSVVLAKLGLAERAGRPVIVVCGGADNLHEPQLSVARAVLGPAVSSAARRAEASVVDGGTDAGVMALIGAERAGADAPLPVLIGVAPAGKVSYPGAPADGRTDLEPHHTHFVLADSDEWGGETELLGTIAHQLAGGAPVAMVVAGGGAVARSEALEAVARHWPLFVIEGSGGVADAIAGLWHRYHEPGAHRAARLLAPRTGRRGPIGDTDDGDLRRILTEGDVRCAANADPLALARSLSWELQDESSLKDAWALFATYDGLAGTLRRTFERFQASILVLGILATLLALVHHEVGGGALHWAVVAAPIVASVLIALANRRAAGKRWVLLRAAAESVKSEIYRYRTATGDYADETQATGPRAPRARRLAAQLDAIDRRLIQSDASSGPLTPYDGPLPPAMYGAEADDDGLSPLDADRYVSIRVQDQLTYYRGKVSDLDRRRGVLQVVTLAAGGTGAILAAAGLEIWVGLTTALAGAALAQLGYLQLDNTIVAYNQSAARLATLDRQFRADRRAPRGSKAFDDLVAGCEAVLTTELGGWVQQMTDALQELHAEQSADSKAQLDDRTRGGSAARRIEDHDRPG